jgi:hypothetical protein
MESKDDGMQLEMNDTSIDFNFNQICTAFFSLAHFFKPLGEHCGLHSTY